MKIIINNATVGTKAARKAFVAQVFNGVKELLTGDKVVIEIDPHTPLPAACAALRNLAGVLDMAADAITGPPDDDEEDKDSDDADFWKR